MAYTGLFNWKAAVGLKAGVTYQLPPLQGDLKFSPSHDRSQSASSETEGTSGSYLFHGANPAPTAYCEAQITCIISQAYLLAVYSTARFADMYTAKHDWDMAIVDGGLGTLTEPLPSGVLQGLGGTSVLSRACTCYIIGQPTYTYHAGAPILEITWTARCPTARWTLALSGGTSTTIPMT